MKSPAGIVRAAEGLFAKLVPGSMTIVLSAIQPAAALPGKSGDMTLTLQEHEVTNGLFDDWFGPSVNHDEIALKVTLSNPTPSVPAKEPNLLLTGYGELIVGPRSFNFAVSGYIAQHRSGLVVGPLRGSIESTNGSKPLIIGYMGRPAMRPDGVSVTIGTGDESNSVLSLDFGSCGPYQPYFERSQAEVRSEGPRAPYGKASREDEEASVGIQSTGGFNYQGASVRAYCGFDIGYLIAYGEEGVTNGVANIQIERWLSDTSNTDAAWESCMSETVMEVKVKEARYGIHMPPLWDYMTIDPADDDTSITVYFYVPGIGWIDYSYTTSSTIADYGDGESDGYRNETDWVQRSASGFDPSDTALQGSYGNAVGHDDSHGFYGNYKTTYHGSETRTEYGNKWAEFTCAIHEINANGYHIGHFDITRVYRDFTVKTY